MHAPPLHIPTWIRENSAQRAVDSPNVRNWSMVHNHLAPLAALLDVEIVLIDNEGCCVGGTGPYVAGLGLKVPHDNALTYSLLSAQSTMVLNPRKDQVCRSCSGRESCTDTANFTGPIIVHDTVVAVVQIVAFTAHQRAQLLVKAEKAFELITQIITVACSREILLSQPEAQTPRQPLTPSSFPLLIGESNAMQHLKTVVLKAAHTDTTVLIQGESGTGKELVAQAIHTHSSRGQGPFIAINCGAIPETLMESELFGYEGGAFSGASSGGKKGLLEQAHGGTFFLDEVSEMPAALQVKLLRVLQEKCFRRIGGKYDYPLNARIIAASNKHLQRMVQQGTFREDLFFRLDVIPIHVPPLRERERDIRLLVAHYLELLSQEKKRTFRVSTALMHRFESYAWPGNVRELRNFVEYGMTFCENDVLTLDVLEARFSSANTHGSTLSSATQPPGQPVSDHRTTDQLSTDQPAIEQQASTTSQSNHKHELEGLLQHFGKHTEGKKALAKHLGISLATLYRRLKH